MSIRVNEPWWHANSVERHIVDRLPFTITSGNLSAFSTDLAYPTRGRLASDWVEMLNAHMRLDGGAYVVVSYYTPIGWWTRTYGWMIPGERYSVTTTRHQGKLRLAVAVYANEYCRPDAWDDAK